MHVHGIGFSSRRSPVAITAPHSSTLRRLARGIPGGSGVLVLVAIAGCDGSTDVWYAAPDTVVLTSLASPEVNAPAAFDFVYGVSVSVEAAGATGTWDVFVSARGDSLTIGAPGVFGIQSGAGIVEFPGQSFEDITSAPGDSTAYLKDASVILRLGTTYVARTRVVADSYGSSCRYFAKLSPLDVDVTNQRVTLVWDRNPYCYSLDLQGNN